MKNFKLGIKLIGGFSLTALIALIIGLTGIFTMRDLSGRIESMGDQSLPSVEHLLRIKGSVSDLTTSLRTLLSSELNAQDRKDIPAQIQAIRETYKKSADAYSALPHDADEAALWKEAQATLSNLAGINNKALGLNERLVELDIMSPDELMGKLQQFRGDHYKLMTDTAKLLVTGEKFDGGTDHTACGFGKWFSGYSTANPKFKEALEAAFPVHKAFHETIHEIKEHAAAGRTQEAQETYKKVLPTAEGVFTQFRVMRGQAEEAQKAFNEMGELLMVESKSGQDKLERVMLEAVDLTTRKSAQEAAVGRSEATRAMTVASVGVVLGVRYL